MDDTVSRAAAIDVLSLGKEILSRVLDDINVVGTDREKYSWGLRLIESYIKDIEELPSVQRQPEEDCDTCKHGYFGDRQCDNCRVRYPSHYEREEEQHGSDG